MSWPAKVLISILVLTFSLALCLDLAVRQPADNFHFLRGQRPFITGTSVAYQHGSTSHTYRAYTMPGNIEDVKRLMDSELIARGFHRMQLSDQNSASWMGKGCVLWLQKGRSYDRREIFTEPGRHSPDTWVTILVSNEPKDDWIQHLRYTLEPNDY